MMRQRSILRYAAALLVAFSSTAAIAVGYPTKPIRMIVPFAAGGGADIVGRLIAQKVSEEWGEPIVVENRAGATGNIGAAFVAKREPDGYTLLFTGPNHSTNISLYDNLTYDPVRDFAPVALLTSAPYILVSNPDFPVRSVSDLISLARAQPGQIAFGSAGNGTAGLLAMELLKSTAGIDMIHVPYKGSAPMLNDLIGGRVSVAFDNILSSSQFIKAGSLRALATSGASRAPSMPDTPTVAQSGLPGFDVTVWQGLLAPAGTPPEIVALLNQKFVAALRTPEITTRLAEMNIELTGSTPAQFAAFLRDDIAKWAKVIKKSGARPD